ncbi:hypothetical protein [Saccharopolyspora gloriosae]|uniref:hypothetical protein n=1 Tax=Saccharopolyspora gloriosae TaxID=455344 RepID=UPI001FB74775|nr:hypothetical protein [Saccharopolyspora gloriosae]
MQMHCKRFLGAFTMRLHYKTEVLGDDMTTTRPAPTGSRIGALDVVRGVAILGTFASNV